MRTIVQIPFQRHRYGPELLVDARFIRSRPSRWCRYPHELDFYEVLFVTKGRGGVRQNSVEASVEPGTAILTPPGSVRTLDLEPDTSRFVLCFQPEFLHGVPRGVGFGQPSACFRLTSSSPAVRLKPQDQQHLLRVLASMELEIGRLNVESRDLLRVRLCDVLLELQRAYRRRFPKQTVVTTWAERFRSLVERNFRETHRVADYANWLAVTPGHLRRLAQVHLGASPKAMIRERILLEARWLLLDDERTVSEIAHELGFEDPSYFCRFFHRWTGDSPLEFRRQARQRRSGAR